MMPVDYIPGFLGAAEADALLDALEIGIRWQQPALRFGGVAVPMPRQTAWIADPGLAYRYSGIDNAPASWTPELAALRDRLNGLVPPERAFNSVLLNRYRDGRDSVSWHADDEPELGSDPVIASVSLGTARTFWLRDNATGRRSSLLLEHSSLLLMRSGLQRTHQHAVLKERVSGVRINLTFRRIIRAR
jgi:alkylated DNA repair dioxygenase AlkB